MKRQHWVAVAVISLFVFYVVRKHRGSGDGIIDYRGEHFKTSKLYFTYEDYKDDPNNLDTNELGRIEQTMVEAPFAATFASSKEFVRALFDLGFPGYGVGGIGDQPQTDDGSTLDVESVEIPQRYEDRYLVARESGGHLTLIDDFVSSTSTSRIKHVKLQGMKLSYYDASGSLVREKQIPQ